MDSFLFPHQRKAVNELHNGAVLWGDVGTGKTLTALAYYVENESPRELIVITTAKKRDSLDWQRDAARFAIGHDSGNTFHGVLTVDSWNNIGAYEGRKDAFFIFDEQRIVGSGAWVKSFINITRSNHWILCTATPGDTWLDYIPVFVANGYFKNRTEFLRSHVVFNRFSRFPKVDRYTGVGTLERLRKEILVEMPYQRHTTRETKIVEVEHDTVKFDKVLTDRWNVFQNKPLRDVAEMFLVLRKVVNSDTSRLEAVKKLLLVHPKLIVFYNHNYELEMLRTLTSQVTSESSSVEQSEKNLVMAERNGHKHEPILKHANTTSSTHSITRNIPDSLSPVPVANPQSSVNKPSKSGLSGSTGITTSATNAGFEIAEWNGHKHQPIPESDRWVYLVQYQAGAEGWNCVETDAMVFYSLTYSYKLWHQAHGRIDRLNTPFSKLHYYVLMSSSVVDKAIWRSLMSKKSFNERRFLSKIVHTESVNSTQTHAN